MRISTEFQVLALCADRRSWGVYHSTPNKQDATNTLKFLQAQMGRENVRLVTVKKPIVK